MLDFERHLDQTINALLIEGKTRQPGVPKPDCALSKEQIDEHYDHHYLGYLEGLKQAEQQLQNLGKSSDYRSILLDYSFNYNGVILHEHYFACLGHQKMPSEVSKLVKDTFGSQKKLENHLKAALLASRGWVILSHDVKSNKLMLNIVDGHDSHVMLVHPILVLDAWEHAYYIDCKSDKSEYVDLIIPDINWEAVEERMLRIENGRSVSRTTV